MTQLGLDFSAPLARKHDPATSHAAAERAREFVASHEAVIYGLLSQAGTRGLTCREMADRSRLDSVQIARRMKSMEARHLIYRQPTSVRIDGVSYRERDGFTVWFTEESRDCQA